MSDIAIAAYHDFTGREPDETEDLAAHWYAPATNFVVNTSRVEAGARLVTVGNPDEHCLILPTGASSVRVSAGGEEVEAHDNTLVVLPPGDSLIEVVTAGYVHRVFSGATQVYARAKRFAASTYPAPPVAPIEPWPDPVGGFKLRRYALTDGTQRTFRTTNMMIKLAAARDERRAPEKMTPHTHDDFEQASLAAHGEWIHHIRRPWGKNLTEWRDDEHRKVGAPSVTIIPPRDVHTSQSVGPKLNQLVDIFAPPRVDFSLTPGKVANADEYPLPESLR
jgi:hypothetical protein